MLFRGGERKKRLGVGQSLGRWHHNIICDATDPKIAPNGAHGEAHGLREVVGTPTVSHGAHLIVLTFVLRYTMDCYTPLDGE